MPICEKMSKSKPVTCSNLLAHNNASLLECPVSQDRAKYFLILSLKSNLFQSSSHGARGRQDQQ